MACILEDKQSLSQCRLVRVTPFLLCTIVPKDFAREMREFSALKKIGQKLLYFCIKILYGLSVEYHTDAG